MCKQSLFCPTTEEYILPVVHGNDRVEWFLQLSDEIIWEVRDKDTGDRAPPRWTRRRHLLRCRPTSATRATRTKRSMLLVWENGTPDLPER